MGKDESLILEPATLMPQVAIKTIKKSKVESEQDLIRIRREIQIMSSIHHPHITHIYEGLFGQSVNTFEYSFSYFHFSI